jgi:hypothetical protein
MHVNNKTCASAVVPAIYKVSVLYLNTLWLQYRKYELMYYLASLS